MSMSKDRTNYYYDRNYSTVLHELSYLLKELGSIYKSELSSEPGHLIANNNYGNFQGRESTSSRGNHSQKISETCTSKEKVLLNSGDTLLDVVETPLLHQMTKEDIIIYFQTEMNKMKRHHDAALKQKTEELLAVNCAHLKEMGCVQIEKEREPGRERKRTSDIILRLERMHAEIQRNGLNKDQCDECLHVKDHLTYLICENQHLRDLLAEERQETNNASADKDIFSNTVKRATIDEAKYNTEISELEIKSIHDVYSATLEGHVQDCTALINAINTEHNELKRSLEDNLLDKEMALKSETERTKFLMQEIEFLSKQVTEMEKNVEEAQLALKQKSKHYDTLCKEMDIQRDYESNHSAAISEHKNVINVLNNKLEMSTKQIQQYMEKISQLDVNLSVVVKELNEAKEHQTMLDDIIRDREAALAACQEVQTEGAKSLMLSLLQLLKNFDVLESNVMEIIQKNNNRLGSLKNLIRQSTQSADHLHEKIFWYKQYLEVKSSNLQKAETEVDLLGDEVDLLSDTLAKIYFALDHYSPVLQHYPAVMEIVKLIKRVLNRRPKAS